MIDAFSLIACWNGLIFGVESLFVKTGLPFAGCCLGILYTYGLMPSPMYMNGFPSAFEILQMFIIVDATQFCLHVSEHRMHFKSHAIHHKKTHPTCSDAFHTGFADAAVQIILPVYGALCCVRPNKMTAAIFGMLYASWLQWIHCDRDWALRFQSRIFVTPSSHRKHHQHPTTNLSHVFVLWDRLYGTAQ